MIAITGRLRPLSRSARATPTDAGRQIRSRRSHKCNGCRVRSSVQDPGAGSSLAAWSAYNTMALIHCVWFSRGRRCARGIASSQTDSQLRFLVAD
jgi:hypothetical protein